MQLPITKTLQAVSRIASKDAARTQLQGVLIEQNGSFVATNSYILIKQTNGLKDLEPNTSFSAPGVYCSAGIQSLKINPKINLGVTEVAKLADADEFPKYQEIISRLEPTETATVDLNASFLANLIKAFQDINGKDCHLTLTIPIDADSSKPSTIACKDTLGLIMPIVNR